MFNLFKKESTTDVVEKVSFKNKTNNEIIEEIHETFYTEVDKLLASAKILNCLDTDKNELIEKCERLKSLGFQNTTEIKEAEEELERLEKLSNENQSKKNLIEAINYFSFKYPNYKFITEESVKKICEKYNLVYGAIDRYVGSVPDKNLKHIEDFKVNKNDECFIYEKKIWGSLGVSFEFISLEKSNEEKRKENEYDEYKHLRQSFSRKIIKRNAKCPLEIAAPLKDFNMNEMEVEDFKLSKIEILDPVVLKPVIFNGRKHYLIVTAWGIEASDGLVVNERFN